MIDLNVKHYFDQPEHKAVNELYFTADGYPFYTADNARAHAGNLKDKNVRTISRADVNAWAAKEGPKMIIIAKEALEAAGKRADDAKTALDAIPKTANQELKSGAHKAVRAANAELVRCEEVLDRLTVAFGNDGPMESGSAGAVSGEVQPTPDATANEAQQQYNAAIDAWGLAKEKLAAAEGDGAVADAQAAVDIAGQAVAAAAAVPGVAILQSLVAPSGSPQGGVTAGEAQPTVEATAQIPAPPAKGKAAKAAK